jgi:uncharacterized protein (TIGR02145 family)
MLLASDTISKALNMEHIGLVIYNTSENLCKNLFKGLHVWNGDEWEPIGTKFPAQVDVFVDSRDAANPVTYRIGKFGEAWWMLENLRAKQYDTKATSRPTLTGPSVTSSSTAAYWSYPSPSTASITNGSDVTAFNQMNEMGFLYNWPAATGYNVVSTTTKYQGICPNGWHLPNREEFTALLTTIYANPCLYGTSTTSSWVVKSPSKVPSSTINTNGSSRSYAEGGFNALLTGYAPLLGGNYGNAAYFWAGDSQIQNSTNLAYQFYFGANDWAESFINLFNQFSVRCVKD